MDIEQPTQEIEESYQQVKTTYNFRQNLHKKHLDQEVFNRFIAENKDIFHEEDEDFQIQENGEMESEMQPEMDPAEGQCNTELDFSQSAVMMEMKDLSNPAGFDMNEYLKMRHQM